MTLRKSGTCKDCKQPVYGDEYGAAGHDCPTPTMLHDDIGNLVKFKENLRWRKWPEEKPIQGGRIICIPENANLKINGIGWKFHFIATFINGEFIDDASCSSKVTHWMPISALPELEKKK